MFSTWNLLCGLGWLKCDDGQNRETRREKRKRIIPSWRIESVRFPPFFFFFVFSVQGREKYNLALIEGTSVSFLLEKTRGEKTGEGG